jgi:putative N6-adenine-specific DNA methylase
MLPLRLQQASEKAVRQARRMRGADFMLRDLPIEAKVYYIAPVERYTILATCSFGLEALVASELSGLGITGMRNENGRVAFEGTAADVAAANIGLRVADRVLLRLAEFDAVDFDALFDGVGGVPWPEFLPERPSVTVHARSVKSKLASVPAIQAASKKSIMETLMKARRISRVEEGGPAYGVEVALSSDRAEVLLDTTGAGLHKRGWKEAVGEAPLRENLAAALVLLSRWDPSRPFADPLCGSGTIPIEAAMIARHMPPGLRRSFAAESWPHIPADVWRGAREKGKAGVVEEDFLIAASDRDGSVLEAARANAKRAGVAEHIRFRQGDARSFKADGDYGCLVCNPPYGERLGGKSEVEALYRAMGDVFRGLPSWSFFVLTAHPDFPRLAGMQATKNRKLYNGNIKTWLYQFFGPLPRGQRPTA